METPQNPTLGKFELTREIEEAGIASLYEAVDTETGRKILLRVLSQSASENPALTRFYDTLEAGSERRVDHPHVLHLIEAGRIDDRFFMAFTYMEGQQLSRLMAEHRVSTEEGIAIIRQAADGLRAIHQKHIVHGDVKPASIMVGKDERSQFAVRIAPLDLASSAAQAMISVYGELIGTPKYMAPEQIEGRPLSPRTDIYSLGIVAYELFSRTDPFDVDSALGHLRAHCEQDPTPLAQLDTSIPTAVSVVVQKMLQRDPRLRYRSAQNLIEDLDRVESRMVGDSSEVVPQGVDSAFAAPPAGAPVARGGSRIFHVAAVLTIIVAILAMAVFMLSRKMSDLQTKLASLEEQPAVPSHSGLNYAASLAPQQTASPQRAPTGNPDEDEFRSALREIGHDVEMRRFEKAISRLEVLGARFNAPEWQARLHAQKARVEFERGLVMHDKGELDAAISVFQGVAKTYKSTQWARQAEQKVPYLLHKKVLAAKGASQWPDAVTIARQLVKEHPKTRWAREALRLLPEVHFRWAEDALAKNDASTAVTQLRIASTEFGDTNYGKRAVASLPSAELRRGQQLLGAGDYAQAVDVLDSARKNYRESPSLNDIQRSEDEALAKWAQGLMAAGKVQEQEWNLPTTIYGCNKLYCEHLGRYYAKHYKQLAAESLAGRVDFRAIRFPGLISEITVPSGGTSDFAPEMIHGAAKGEPYACFVRPDSRIPFMLMVDAVEAILCLARARPTDLSQAIYNITAFNPSAEEIRQLVLEGFPAAEITFAPDQKRQAIVDSWPADVDDSRAREDWGLAPRYELGSAFTDFLIPRIRTRYE